MKIKVYTADWCGACTMLRPALRKNDIEYEEIDIEADGKSAKEANVRGVPTLDIYDGDKPPIRLIGFSKETITRVKEILGKENE